MREASDKPMDELESRLVTEVPAYLAATAPRSGARDAAERAMRDTPRVERGSAWAGVRAAGAIVAGLVIVAAIVGLRGVTAPAATGPRASLAAAGVPTSVLGLPVISVPEAIAIRNSGSSQRIAIGGWYAAYDVPCPAIPDAVLPFEDCLVGFSWLMAQPDQLAHDNSIGPPAGAGVNVVVDLGGNGDPVPVVFVGHFNDPGAAACPSGSRRDRCEQRFVVDTVAWPPDLQSTPTPASTTTPPSSVPTTTPAPASGPLRSADATGVSPSGALWAIGGSSLWISGDLGATWHRGSLPSLGPSNGPPPTFVLDTRHAWVVTETSDSVDNGNGPTVDHAHLIVSRTVDGGETWDAVAVPGDHPDTSRSIVFTDAEHGFLMVSGGRTNSGSSTVLRTDDGGRTWQVVATVPATNEGSIGSVIAVTDPSTIWAAAQAEAGPVNHPLLSVSRDGGRTWSTANLPGMIPQWGGTAIQPLGPPAFLDARTGLFAVTTGDPSITGDPSGDPRTYVFGTSDGGATWTLRSQLATEPLAIAFVSPTQWVVSESAAYPPTLSMTNDAGGTWNEVNPVGLTSGPLVQVDRIDGSHLLGTLLIGGNTGQPQRLVVSEDGGRSWHEVTPATP